MNVLDVLDKHPMFRIDAIQDAVAKLHCGGILGDVTLLIGEDEFQRLVAECALMPRYGGNERLKSPTDFIEIQTPYSVVTVRAR